MCEKEPTKDLVPAVANYCPAAIKGLKKGEVKKWCVCGLSKKQPWCDGSHKGTGFKSLEWVVPSDQDTWYLCMCKHTKSPPLCDGTHTSLPKCVEEKIKNCEKGKDGGHKDVCKLCTDCGWTPDF